MIPKRFERLTHALEVYTLKRYALLSKSTVNQLIIFVL
nr:MAG TPA: hypothetical protein [Caudoviricetes sp.]